MEHQFTLRVSRRRAQFSQDKIKNEPLASLITSIIAQIPKTKSPIVIDDTPLLSKSTNIVKVDAQEDPPAMGQLVANLPPDDINFASLYVFKKDLLFSKQEDFISFGTTLKRSVDIVPEKKPVVTFKKLRYVPMATGSVKNNPDRVHRGVKKKKSKT